MKTEKAGGKPAFSVWKLQYKVILVKMVIMEKQAAKNSLFFFEKFIKTVIFATSIHFHQNHHFHLK